LRPLQKNPNATIKPIPEAGAKEEDEENLPTNLTVNTKLLIGMFPPEKRSAALQVGSWLEDILDAVVNGKSEIVHKKTKNAHV
jgi:hypothetical protein